MSMPDWLEKKAKDIEARAREMLPDYMVKPLMLYLLEGIQPGSFLTAVLENNLKQAACAADSINQKHLAAWGQFIVWYMPQDSQGSPENVENWKGWNNPDEATD